MSAKAIASEAQAGLAKRITDESRKANCAHLLWEIGLKALKSSIFDFPIATENDSH